MSNYSKIYWLTRLDGVHDFLLAIFLLSIGAIVAHFLFVFLGEFDEMFSEQAKKEWTRGKNIALFFIVFAGLALVLVPTKNDMILIYAGGKTMDYVESDSSSSKVPHQTTSIISEYLDKSIEEMKSKK